MKNKAKPVSALKLAQLCCRALDAKKAEDLLVLDVSAQSSITDYLVLATATSEPHLRALRMELEKTLDGAETRIIGVELTQESGWVVVDLFDVMVHLFLPEIRIHYALENLWKDAVKVPPAKLAMKLQKKSRRKKGSIPSGD